MSNVMPYDDLCPITCDAFARAKLDALPEAVRERLEQAVKADAAVRGYPVPRLVDPVVPRPQIATAVRVEGWRARYVVDFFKKTLVITSVEQMADDTRK
ncbi:MULTISPECIES: hypothetical protein [unclassified Corallococcus]|uniref:hypothetical protein n=1 Tax=unclassified Corallococcus TaxID=2685029 RepID=UPI001A8FC68D|nr:MULTISPECIES: hypothetical protein [unclassified Corallococcus]MBN9683427.1 hypothetical protein [Corallococcus sp. NCSPR001]WAS85055.1 hypothetical protein O0N60_38105 [Corallococcus sp. NCRR]